eukprot:TRINITY_DN12075_c0_g1_i1.p1 TRINITY_DN12075_c0_g1~~TRINITY_DN12075_c0_g1_i1.p1  ORF type:complete len:323 (+),score=46.31 TRINITY_DN12075_c0_g1_i1:64-1032(+)
MYLFILPSLLSVLVPRVAAAYISVEDTFRNQVVTDQHESVDPNRNEPWTLFAITSSKKPEYVDNRQACLDTWAASIPRNNLLIVGVTPTPTSPAISAPALDCPDTHVGGACKDAIAIAKAAELRPNWLVLVGDDNYVCVSNIETELKKHNPDNPIIIGIKGCGAENCSLGGLCGGGGQIFSRAMVQHMVQPSTEAFLEEHRRMSARVGMWGDVANCAVAANHGGNIVDDVLGLNGWKMKPEEVSAAIDSAQPPPLTFHSMDPITMRATHLELKKAQGTLKQGEEFIDIPRFRDIRETFIKRRARYVAEENERRKLSRKVRPA